MKVYAPLSIFRKLIIQETVLKTFSGILVLFLDTSMS